jgi:hypothetical protein
MALIRLAFVNFLSRSGKPGEATNPASAGSRFPQQFTAFAGPSQNSANFPEFATFVFWRRKHEGVMHLSANSKPGRLPRQFPIGTTYVVEGCGGGEGQLRVFSRYVVLPGGRRINLANDFSGPAAPRARRRNRNQSENSAQKPAKDRLSRDKKIVAGGGTARQHRR